jgi:hypothetical protein
LLGPWAQEQVLARKAEVEQERELVWEEAMGLKGYQLVLAHTPSFVSIKRQIINLSFKICKLGLGKQITY